MIHTMVDTSLPSFPHLIEFTIPDTSVIAVYFNKKGNHLAGCCNNGYLLIWDVATMTLLRSLHGHAAAVTCASWSKSGRYLASGGLDHKCLLWDITSSKILHEFEFDVPIIHVAIHPHQRCHLLISRSQSPPVWVNTRTQEIQVFPLSDPKESLAIWDGPGTHVFVGSVKGHWWVFLFPSLQEGSFKDHFHASIRHFALSKSGHSLAITLADKTVQVYALPYDPQHPFECVPILKCHDPVNRQAWSSCAWSANETYLIGATIGHTHVFHVWRKESGTLVTLLEGPAEPILHFAWHPTLPYCVSVSHYGTIVVWNTFTQEKWSAYAPGFQEIEENVEYIEREDEFDRDSSPPTSPSLQPTSGYLDFHSTSLIDLESDEEMFWVTVNLEEQRTDIPKQPALLHQVHGQNEHEPKKRKRNMV